MRGHSSHMTRRCWFRPKSARHQGHEQMRECSPREGRGSCFRGAGRIPGTQPRGRYRGGGCDRRRPMAASRAGCECARETSRNSWDTFGCADAFVTFVRVGVVGPQEWRVRGEKRGLRFLSLTRVWFQTASMLKRAAWPLLGVVGAWADRRRGRF